MVGEIPDATDAHGNQLLCHGLRIVAGHTQNCNFGVVVFHYLRHLVQTLHHIGADLLANELRRFVECADQRHAAA